MPEERGWRDPNTGRWYPEKPWWATIAEWSPTISGWLGAEEYVSRKPRLSLGEQKWGRPQVTGWEYEMPSMWEYQQRLTAHLQQLVNRYMLTLEAAERIEVEAFAQVEEEGISPKLPYYKEIVLPSPEWSRQRGAEIAETLTEQERQKWIREHPEEMWEQERGRFLRPKAEAYRRQTGRRAPEEPYAGLVTAIREAEALGVESKLIEKARIAMGSPDINQVREAWKLAEATKPYEMGQREQIGLAMAGEFPKQWQQFQRETFRPGTRGVRSPYQQFTTHFQAQPEYEETKRGWEVKQYKEYPQLYPWYQEEGGWKTGKPFQEWIKKEPIATAYLKEKEAERIRQPLPKTKKRWQSTRQWG